MLDKKAEEMLSKDDRIRHMFETQGDGPTPEQRRIDGGQQLIQQSNREQKDKDD